MIPLVIKATTQKPPSMVRVMTYSPFYHGAKISLERGIGILLWNEDEKRWCDDNGETALFPPIAWWYISIPESDLKKLL